MTKQEQAKADKFVVEHVMYLYGGLYYAVDTTKQHTIEEEGETLSCFRGVSDQGDIAFFETDEVEKEFPHIDTTFIPKVIKLRGFNF